MAPEEVYQITCSFLWSRRRLYGTLFNICSSTQTYTDIFKVLRS